MPITACDRLYERVLPFHEALGVELGAVLTDNGRDAACTLDPPKRSETRNGQPMRTACGSFASSSSFS